MSSPQMDTVAECNVLTPIETNSMYSIGSSVQDVQLSQSGTLYANLDYGDRVLRVRQDGTSDEEFEPLLPLSNRSSEEDLTAKLDYGIAPHQSQNYRRAIFCSSSEARIRSTIYRTRGSRELRQIASQHATNINGSLDGPDLIDLPKLQRVMTQDASGPAMSEETPSHLMKDGVAPPAMAEESTAVVIAEDGQTLRPGIEALNLGKGAEHAAHMLPFHTSDSSDGDDSDLAEGIEDAVIEQARVVTFTRPTTRPRLIVIPPRRPATPSTSAMQPSNATEGKEKVESKATGSYPRRVNFPVTPPNASPIAPQTLCSELSPQSMISSVRNLRTAQETTQQKLLDKLAIFNELAAAIDASGKSGGRRMTLNSTLFKYLCDHQQLYYAEIIGSDCSTPKFTASLRGFPASRSHVYSAPTTEPLLDNLGINESASLGITLRDTVAHASALPGLRDIFNTAPENLLELLLATFTAYHYAKIFLDAQLPTNSKTITAAKSLPQTDLSPTGSGSEGIPRKFRANLGMGLTMPESPAMDQPSANEDEGTRHHEKTTRMMMVAATLLRMGKLAVAECLGARPPVMAVIDAFTNRVDAVVCSAEKCK